MEFAFLVYVIGTLFPVISGIGVTLTMVGCVIGIIWVVGAPFWIDDDFEEERASFVNGTKTFLKWAVPIIIVCSLVPEKEVSYTMIAAYTAQSIGENEKVQNIAGQSLEVIEAFLEKTKAELETKDVEK